MYHQSLLIIYIIISNKKLITKPIGAGQAGYRWIVAHVIWMNVFLFKQNPEPCPSAVFFVRGSCHLVNLEPEDMSSICWLEDISPNSRFTSPDWLFPPTFKVAVYVWSAIGNGVQQRVLCFRHDVLFKIIITCIAKTISHTPTWNMAWSLPSV